MTLYITHFCKNPKCNNIFLDKDIYKRNAPQSWRYCLDCEAKGYPVIKKDPNADNKKESKSNNLRKYWSNLKAS